VSGRRRRVLGAGLRLGSAALAVHLVLPQLAGLEATGRALATATWWAAVAVVGLEVASLAAYGALTAVVLRGMGTVVPVGLAVRASVVGTAVGRTLPGGNAAALALNVTALRAAGVDPTRGATGLAASGLLSSLVLALLLPIGALVNLRGGGTGGTALGLAGLAVAVMGGWAVVGIGRRRPDGIGRAAGRLVRPLARGPLRGRLDPAAVATTVARAAGAVRALTLRPAALRGAAGWAAANWLLDIAALAVVATTVGRGTPLTALLLAYVLAQVVAAVPLTPGGVGVVETAMVSALVASGAPAAAATATVLGWRLVSHWLPIPVGLILLVIQSRR